MLAVARAPEAGVAKTPWVPGRTRRVCDGAAPAGDGGGRVGGGRRGRGEGGDQRREHRGGARVAKEGTKAGIFLFINFFVLCFVFAWISRPHRLVRGTATTF